MNKLVIEQTNLNYQLVDLSKKLKNITKDEERFKLRLEVQQKLFRLKQVQKEVYEQFNNILK